MSEYIFQFILSVCMCFATRPSFALKISRIWFQRSSLLTWYLMTWGIRITYRKLLVMIRPTRVCFQFMNWLQSLFYITVNISGRTLCYCSVVNAESIVFIFIISAERVWFVQGIFIRSQPDRSCTNRSKAFTPAGSERYNSHGTDGVICHRGLILCRT